MQTSTTWEQPLQLKPLVMGEEHGQGQENPMS